MTGPKLVEIRGGAPLHNDIPGQLEQLADDIRAGRESPVVALIVLRDEGGNLDSFGYGCVGNEDEMAGMLMRAAQHAAMRADLDYEDDAPKGAA